MKYSLSLPLAPSHSVVFFALRDLLSTRFYSDFAWGLLPLVLLRPLFNLVGSLVSLLNYGLSIFQNIQALFSVVRRG